MPVNTREMMSVVSTLAENRNMRVAVKESVKGGCVAGAGAMVGGLLMGPVGIALGGVVGACSAAVMSRGKFKPVAHIILYDITPSQQERLATSVGNVVADLRIEDAAMLLPLLMSNVNLQTLVIREVIKFLQAEMGLQVLC